MSQSVTLNLFNPTSEPVVAEVFQSPTSLTQIGVGEGAGEPISSVTSPANFTAEYSLYQPYINSYLIFGINLTTGLVGCYYYNLNDGLNSFVHDIPGATTIQGLPISLSNVTDLDGNPNAQGVVLTVVQGGFVRQVFVRKDVGDVPISEYISNTSVAGGVGSAKSISIVSVATNQLWVLSEAGGSFDIVGIDNINEPFGFGGRVGTLYGLGLTGANRPFQFKHDAVNNKIIMVTNEAIRSFIVFDIGALAFNLLLGSAGWQAYDCEYIEHRNEYYLYYRDGLAANYKLRIFDAATLAVITEITDPAVASGFDIFTMSYDFSTKNVLFKNFLIAGNGLCFFNSDTRTVVGVNNDVQCEATYCDNQFDLYYPSGNNYNRVNGTSGTVLTTVDLNLFTSNELLIGDLIEPITQFLSPGSFSAGQQLYIPGTAVATGNGVLNIFSGQSTIGTSPITVEPEAGGLTYAQITQQIQNQDYVITDLYIRTFSVAQANKTVTVNWINPNGANYNEEHFPTINPMQPQLVIKDLPFNFTSNAINDINYEILPNETVEFIFTYEEFGSANAKDQFPDAKKLNKLLGMGEFEEKNGIDLEFKNTQSIYISNNPLTRIIFLNKYKD